MDLTGYGYKRPSQEKVVAPSPVVPANPERSPELSDEALRLLTVLEKKLQLRELPARFPRILNRIASVWNQPNVVQRYFEELLLDPSGARAGFPPEVMSELFSLRHHNASRIFPKKSDPWQEMHLR